MERFKKRTELCLIAAQETHRAFEASRGPIRLPVPVEEIAAWLGFQVVSLMLVPDEFSAILSSRDKLIGVNGRHHRHRRRFSLCHELAHLLLNHPPEGRSSLRAIALCNAEADECAAELLIPSKFLLDDSCRSRSLQELTLLFDASEEAVARKIRSLEPGVNRAGRADRVSDQPVTSVRYCS